MYCARCGVELAKGAPECPLCGLRAFHPDIEEESAPSPYPPHIEGDAAVRRGGALFILSAILAVPVIVCLITDVRLTGCVSWSGYVTGGLLALWCAVCPSLMMRRPDPVITVPIALAAGLLLSLYICLKTGGRWFLPFAFPAGGAFILICECAVVLLRHTVRGSPHRVLFILGGCSLGFGGLCVLIEFLLKVAFGKALSWWSLYPLCCLGVVGLILITAGICRPIRTALHKKLFI